MLTVRNTHRLLVIIACFLAVPLYLLHASLEKEEQDLYQNRLQQQALLNFNHAQRSLHALYEQLMALRSTLEIKHDLSRRDFDYFNAQQTNSDYGVVSFEWIPRIPVIEQPLWQERARAEGIFDFRFSSKISGEDYIYPIYYTSSAQMNGTLLGINMADKADVKRAMQQAKQLNRLQIGISENSDIDETEGAEMRLILPVYTNRESTTDIRGYVSAMIRFEEAMNVMLGPILNRDNNLVLQIFDITTGSSDLLFSSQQQIPSLSTAINFYDELGGHRFHYRFTDVTPPPPWWQLSKPSLTVLGISLFTTLLMLALLRAVSHRAEAEALVRKRTLSLKAARSEYHNLFEKVVEGVYSASLDGRFFKVNPALAKAFGYGTPQEMLYEINSIGEQLHHDNNQYKAFIQQLTEDGQVLNFEWRGIDANGQEIWLSENAYMAELPDGTPIYEGTIDLITERKLNEQMLSYQARHDALTGLLNRSAFQQALEHRLQQSHEGAVLFIDLDGFKKINDSLGHGVGDKFLQALAQRLKQSLRQDDLLARIGGDEFVVFSPGPVQEADIRHLAERIQSQISRPIEISGYNNQLQGSGSIGIALVQAHHEHADDVLRDADLAMYVAKKNGKAGHHLFTLALHEQAQQQNLIESQLRQALKNKEFKLHYQPVIRMEDGSLRGFEALLRWKNPVLGDVPPDSFIAIAEETQLIDSIGIWLMRQAMRDLVDLQSAADNPGLTMNINLSPRQLKDDHLLQLLPQLVKESGARPQRINFELTESALYEDETNVKERLSTIQQMGFGIYIDDFGTGHSSLQRLVRFPVNGLKIDRSFVDQIEQDHNKAIVVEVLLIMAKALDLNVVAEGIETEGQQQFLQNLGCLFGQGYLYLRPTPIEQLIHHYKEQKRSAIDLKPLNIELCG